jgi:hypothetical protein
VLHGSLPERLQREQLAVLSSLLHLTSLELCGAAPAASAVTPLAQLTQLKAFHLEVTDTLPNVPLPLSQLPGWQDASQLGDEHSSSNGSNSSTRGAVLGACLAQLTGLTSLSLSGTLQASDTLQALSGLPDLVRVDLCSLPDFAVNSLTSLTGLTSLTALRVHGCKALQATARSALPLQLHVLQKLAVLDLDCDLHLRDMQVIMAAGLHALCFECADCVFVYTMRVRHTAVHKLTGALAEVQSAHRTE